MSVPPGATEEGTTWNAIALVAPGIAEAESDGFGRASALTPDETTRSPISETMARGTKNAGL